MVIIEFIELGYYPQNTRKGSNGIQSFLHRSLAN